MILGKKEIIHNLTYGGWTAHRDGVLITPDELTINPNSVNVSLGGIALSAEYVGFIDLHNPESVKWRRTVFSDADPLILRPGSFCLAHVRERFDCAAWDDQGNYFVPMIEGRSTVARCGLSIHSSAGFGDFNFSANFTLELTTAVPIALRPGDEIAQIVFQQVSSATKYESVYSDQFDEPRAPVLSRERFQRS